MRLPVMASRSPCSRPESRCQTRQSVQAAAGIISRYRSRPARRAPAIRREHRFENRHASAVVELRQRFVQLSLHRAGAIRRQQLELRLLLRRRRRDRHYHYQPRAPTTRASSLLAARQPPARRAVLHAGISAPAHNARLAAIPAAATRQDASRRNTRSRQRARGEVAHAAVRALRRSAPAEACVPNRASVLRCSHVPDLRLDRCRPREVNQIGGASPAGSRLSPGRSPLAREPLRLGDLRPRHSGRQDVAQLARFAVPS